MDNQKQWQKQVNGCAFDLIDALQAPILTFSSHWKETISRRVLDIIPIARMIALLNKEELATLEECFVYIGTRTLDAPLDHEWAVIYIHVGCKTRERWFNDDCWEEMRAPKELNEWLQSKLDELRRYLYNKRREVLRQQRKKTI